MNSAVFLLSPPLSLLPPKLPTILTKPSPHPLPTLAYPHLKPKLKTSRPDFRIWADDGDADGGDADYDMDEDEADEVDNKKDYDVEYEPLVDGDDITMIHSTSFVSTRGWDSEMIVDYRINEDEFHKISLLDCDFFIRKPPDPDNNVYDFREMYVTPPDTDIYAIPRVLAPMPQKYIRCAMSDYGCYNVTEPPIDAPRDPMYKSEREISKREGQGEESEFVDVQGVRFYLRVRQMASFLNNLYIFREAIHIPTWKPVHIVFLTKHYRNRRLGDPEFVLDFEEIYVIDSKAKSITRARVVVTVPEGRNRDRKNDLLVIRDNGNSFKIIPSSEREDPTTVIEKEEWDKTRQDMERHLRKLRDFSVSNWF